MRPPVPSLELSEQDRAFLAKLATSLTASHSNVRRAQALLMASDGLANLTIGEASGVSHSGVAAWRARFAAEGWAKLGVIRKGRGRKPSLSPEKVEAIVHATIHEKPAGQTHWSCRTSEAFLAAHNEDPRLAVWTAKAEDIIATVRRGRAALNAIAS